MVLGDYGTADFREYRTSLQYIYKCKKNKAQDAERRKQSKKGKRNKADQGYDPEEDQPQGKKRRSSGQNGSMDSAKRSSKKRRQWKIILEDLDTWQKYSFIFYDEVGIGRAKRNDNYEKYLPLHEDGRVSKQHCVIIQRGDCLYLMDDIPRTEHT